MDVTTMRSLLSSLKCSFLGPYEIHIFSVNVPYVHWASSVAEVTKFLYAQFGAKFSKVYLFPYMYDGLLFQLYPELEVFLVLVREL
ncbi:hypothetical protein V6N13_109879 [Hibiscus sabdariffa]